MCGNGLRCTAHYTNTVLLPNNKHLLIETDVGIRRATVEDDLVEVEMGHLQDGKPWNLTIQNTAIEGILIDVGVPHAVIPVRYVQNTDVQTLGSSIRFHERFAPSGTNVTFVSPSKDPRSDLLIRTYERGVERETLACGTGAVAAAIGMWQSFSHHNCLKLQCQSKEILSVRRHASDKGNWYTLQGKVFCLGIIDETLPQVS